MPTVTRSRQLDRALFAAALVVMTLAGLRNPVYYRVTPTRVSVVAITADGTSAQVATPPSLEGVSDGVEKTVAAILRFSRTREARRLTPHGGYLRWSVTYSVDSARFDRVRTVTTR